jgi:nitric oxide reductase subunit B
MSEDLAGAWRWKWALALTHVGVIGMTMAMLIAGYEQSFIERANEGSTWGGYFAGQVHPWFVSSMHWRMVFGVVTTLGVAILLWDLAVIGKREIRSVKTITPLESYQSGAAAAPA